MSEPLSLWVVTENPSDFPGQFAAREHRVSAAGTVIGTTALVARSLEELRELLPEGLVRMERNPADDPVIVEVWL